MALQKYRRTLGANLYKDSEAFKFDSFSPEHTHKLVEALVLQEGGWTKADNKVVDSVTKAIIWGLERGTNIEKLNKTSEEGVKALNKALKTLKIKAKDPKKLGSNKITISRLMSAYPILTCEILMKLGPQVVKVIAQPDLPFYFKFPAALSFLPTGDAVDRPKLLLWLAEFDKVINKGTPTDEVKRRNFESVVSASPIVPDSERVDVVKALKEFYEANKATFEKERDAAKAESAKASLQDAGVEDKTIKELDKLAAAGGKPGANSGTSSTFVALKNGDKAKMVMWVPDDIVSGKEQVFLENFLEGKPVPADAFGRKPEEFMPKVEPFLTLFMDKIGSVRANAVAFEADEAQAWNTVKAFFTQKKVWGIKA